MKKQIINSLVIIAIVLICGCNKNDQNNNKVRQVIDTIGFAKYDWQVDSIMDRLDFKNADDNLWRVAITPHDDYAYVGDLYPQVLNGVKARIVLFFGVAHKARNYNLENQIVFDSFNAWSAPYNNVQVSEIRNELIKQLPDSLYIIHDDMHSIEHSLEAIIPFLQYNNRELEIIPILVPYMSYDKMMQISEPLSKALSGIMKKKNLNWGDDIAVVISTDAVHYGDEDWGGSNYAPYGTDSIGLIEARNHEIEIIENCLTGDIDPEKIQKFIHYTVQEENYKEYKWTWCGRYSVPFGLLFSHKLNKYIEGQELSGSLIGYSNSIDSSVLDVSDLQIGTTAPANNRHWVGYAAVGYE